MEIREKLWAVVCEEAGICGALPSLKEAKELYKDIKGCPAKHKIVKCWVEILLKNYYGDN